MAVFAIQYPFVMPESHSTSRTAHHCREVFVLERFTFSRSRIWRNTAYCQLDFRMSSQCAECKNSRMLITEKASRKNPFTCLPVTLPFLASQKRLKHIWGPSFRDRRYSLAHHALNGCQKENRNSFAVSGGNPQTPLRVLWVVFSRGRRTERHMQTVVIPYERKELFMDELRRAQDLTSF